MSFLEISLYWNVSWTSGFARCGASCIGAGLSRGVAIILIPSVFAPFEIIWEWGFWIFKWLAVSVAKLLTEFWCASRANFDAIAASDALGWIDFCDERAAGKVWSIE